MKTTIEIPDDLFRRAKAKAALDGKRLKDIVTEGLKLVVESSPSQKAHRVKFPLIPSKGKRRLTIPDDIASRIESQDDIQRHEASLR